MHRAFSVLVPFLFAFASAASGAPILQNVANNRHQILAGEPLGQTFTADDPTVNLAGFYLADMNPGFAPNDFAIDVLLYEGAGTGGALLGAITFDTIQAGGGWATVDFGGIPVVVGNTYSLAADDDNSRWGVAFVTSVAFDYYDGGTAFFKGFDPAASYFNVDFTFHIGPRSTSEVIGPRPEPEPIPEPSVLPTLAVGLGALFAARRRKGAEAGRCSIQGRSLH